MQLSKLRTQLRPDDPVVQDAEYSFDEFDRAYIDEQARAAQEHLATCLLNGLVATWLPLDGASDPLAAGDCVCLLDTALASAFVTKALPAALAAAGRVYGVALRATAPGARVLIALAGVIAPALSGLPVGPLRFVRCSAAARGERVAKFSPTDFPLGTATSAGFLTLSPLPLVSSLLP